MEAKTSFNILVVLVNGILRTLEQSWVFLFVFFFFKCVKNDKA